MASCEASGREASPSAGVINSQTVKTTESGGPRGYDAGEKIKGRKRHILTDTEGDLVHALMPVPAPRCPGIAAVGEEITQQGEAMDDFGEQRCRAVAVLDVGGVDHR